MTQEEKQLFLKDLSARLPYDVMVDYGRIPLDLSVGVCQESHIYILNEIDPACKDIDYITVRIQDVERLMCAKSVMIEEIKQYLRPLSSMNEEEKIELYQIAGFYYLSNNELLKDEWRQFSGALSENKLFLPYPIWEDNLNKVYDWLNAHHFDYRGLIEKGLALEAQEDMYKI